MKNCEVLSCNQLRFMNFSKNDEGSLENYLKEIAKIPTLSAQEEKSLAKKIANGDKKAKEALVKGNLRLAANIAFKIKNSKMTYSDLLQEANIGLMIAIEKYNYKLGYRFSTYATWWIKQSVLKAISEQAGCMKVPVYVQEIVGKYKKLKAKIENEQQKTLNIEQMAHIMQIEPNKLEEYINAFQSNMSLDEQIGQDSEKENSLMDIIADENANATAKAEYDNLKEAILETVSELKEREKNVVVLRFGLNDMGKKTLDEIGKMYGITKECVRQTEIRAIKKLKDFCVNRDIALYCCQ